jgi:hypothetical protein
VKRLRRLDELDALFHQNLFPPRVPFAIAKLLYPESQSPYGFHDAIPLEL